MFKKLKAELKAVFKSKKTGSSKAKKGDLQPLQEQQQQQNLSQSYDGGLGRPCKVHWWLFPQHEY